MTKGGCQQEVNETQLEESFPLSVILKLFGIFIYALWFKRIELCKCRV